MAPTLKHDIKADFLLEKGMELLWSKGYNATSVNDIVKAAEIPKGSFYFYFESKEDFAVKAIQKYFDQNITIIVTILNSNEEPSPRQRLMNFHKYRADVLRDELGYSGGCMACNVGNEMSEHSEKIRNAIHAKQVVLIDIIAKVIQQAQNVGEIDNSFNAHDMASFLEDAGKGAMISMKETNSSYPIENFLRMTERLL
ncbi:MAG: TetR/AcrR family transcriptional regulator [Flavobacteriaceae bacterium]|nr:TetR/AcrR family transcriptional regulator [Flavobacteriaceae bacterium]